MSYDISIIIPVYNAKKYLAECVNSIVLSTVFSELEIVLVNDGSTDGCKEICDSFSKKYENIKAIHIENGGVSNARNTGIKASTGEYITFCDSDDYYLKDIFKKIVPVLKSKAPDLLFFDFLYEQETCAQTVSYPFQNNVLLNKDCVLSKIPEFMLESQSFNSVWNKVFKKALLSGLEFNVSQKHGEDRDFLLEILLKCNNAYYLNQEGYFYRFVKTGAVNKARFDYFDNIQNELNFRLEIYKRFNIPYSRTCRLCEASAAHQIMSCVFLIARASSFLNFKKIMSYLYTNERLMSILKNEKADKVSKLVVRRQTFKIFSYVKYLAFKEKVYKLL